MNLKTFNDFKTWPTSRCDRWFAATFVGLTLFQLFILLTAPVDLVSDEALYWEYSKHLDWSYYAKGPLIALANWLSTHIFGDTTFGVRVGALACFSAFSAGAYLFIRRTISAPAALFIFVFIRLTVMFAFTGFAMTTDSLVLPFWLASLIYAEEALKRDAPKLWIPSFILCGLAVLAKYTAVLLLPAYGFVLLLSKTRRRHLWSGGFWIAAFAFALTMAPILIWNARHEWVNIGHNVGHTVGTKKGIPFLHLPELVGSQILLLGPIGFWLIGVALLHALKSWRTKRDDVAGVWAMATIPLLLVSVMVTATRSCYPNWPLPAYVGGVILLARYFDSSEEMRKFGWALKSNAAVFLALQLLLYVALILPVSINLPTPIRRMTGWTKLSSLVAEKTYELEKNGKSSGRPFVLTYDYMSESSLRFALPENIEVRLGSFEGRRLSEQDYWQTWDELKGHDAVVVGSDDHLPPEEVSKKWFEHCEPLNVAGMPAPQRLAKPFGFLFCKNFTGAAPEISTAF